MKERNRFEHEIADLEFERSDSHTLPVKAPLKMKRFLFVASFDHEDATHNLRGYCINRIKRILRKTRGADTDPSINFTLFDIKEGKIKSFDVSGKKRVWADVSTFTPVTRANYTGRVFDKSPSGVMSITDVYDFIRNIGRNDPGTVQELNFFGHGWHGGPILVNSKDNSGTAARDPNDKDGRSLKDFKAPNMNATALSELSLAFASDGFTWLWGCVFAAAPFQVLHRLLKNRLYKSGKLKNDDLIKFEFTRSHADKFFAQVPSFFPTQRVDGTFPLSFHRSLTDIKALCQLMIDLGYCRKIATATNRKCYGALPGTYSDFEKTRDLPLMLIPRNTRTYSDNFAAFINFYKKHMGKSLDPEDRGYGEHVP
ncbi:MAG: hypothetical protein HOP17_04155 [Acidobacteria bacterium]|nr:hypothetical protein [Acidobacteriota bacterium]